MMTYQGRCHFFAFVLADKFRISSRNLNVQTIVLRP